MKLLTRLRVLWVLALVLLLMIAYNSFAGNVARVPHASTTVVIKPSAHITALEWHSVMLRVVKLEAKVKKLEKEQ